MARFSWLGLIGLVALGCSSSSPNPPPAEGSGASAGESAQPAPANEAAAESPAVSTPTSLAGPPTKKEDSLRDLAARLVVGDAATGWRIAEEAATELEKLGPRATDDLVPLLRDPSAPVRRGAAFYLLGKFDPAQADHVAGFARLLDDEDQTLRGFGLTAVKKMHRPDQISAVPRLAAMLTAMRETKPENRAAIARLIGGLKRDGSSAAEALATAASDDPDAKVRAACLAALVQVSEPGASLAPLANGLGDADPAVRLVAAAKLESFGSASAPAAKQLAAALADDDQRVREKAADALIRIGVPAVETLAAQLTSPNVEAKKLALASLAKIGPAARAALPAIARLKSDADADVKKLAEIAAQRISK